MNLIEPQSDLLKIVGGTALHGTAKSSGAKNSMQFLVTAALLTDHVVELSGLPLIQDVFALAEILQALNCETKLEKDQERITLCAKKLKSTHVPFDLGSRLRSTLLFVPGLLSRFGQASIPHPGGDRIGARPLDTHFYIIHELGGTVTSDEAGLTFTASRLKAKILNLPFPSFTGTGFAMLLASTIPEVTLINNAAKEPELIDLALLLKQMGVAIEGVGTPQIEIQGANPLGGAALRIMPDRLEAGTLLMAAMATCGSITLPREDLKHLSLLCNLLEAAGCTFLRTENEVTAQAPDRLLAQSIKTGPYPEFPTDLQPQFMALMTQASGRSHIRETLYTNRFRQVPYLQRMGGALEIDGQSATVEGITHLRGTDVEAHDIRGGAALLIAALAAQGETRLRGTYHLERGHARLYEKLAALGAKVFCYDRKRC
ncbi:MAG: UDP-N-acetylglucosamine 1-carboxyvinyltransferase [Armatimonadota bacterium]